MRCALCRQRPATADLLCGPCVEDMGRPYRFTRDRVRTIGNRPSSTVLLDPWGRAHPLVSPSLIGRHVDHTGVEVIEASVSRSHAELSRTDDGTWQIRDLGSTNGTLVNEVRITDVTPLRPADRLRFGQVGFYFAELPVMMSGPTRAPGGRIRHAPSTLPEEAGADEDDDAFEEDAVSTRIGLPSIAIELLKTPPTGGLVEVDGKRAQLTMPQYELLELLCLRSLAEADGPAATRGFVSSLELIQRISWDTPQRIDDHLKQLVHRLRRHLDRAGIGDLIESRHGFGYRLRVTPAASTGDDG
jgi:DNA-binding winged helix-turn-helix (wHTH) protein